jgi:signal peptidase I
MELTTSKRVLATLLSAIVPGSGQVLKREMKKALVYLTLFAVALFLYSPLRVPETYVGLMAVKIGAICLALIASLDAWLTGAASKPRYLIVIPVLAALILGDVPTGGIALADGFRIYKVPSRGMQPSIMEGDRIVADTKYYETRTLKRGETVVVVLPNNTYVAKRVLAVGGDTIQGSGDQVWLNGQLLREPYTQYTGGAAASGRLVFGPIWVVPGKLFLMGDNRDMSLDSRDPSFGQISVQRLHGKVLYVYFSRMPSRWGRKIE